MVAIEVRSRVSGPSADDLPAVLVQLAEGCSTARELIRCAVEEQIREPRADAARCRRILDRRYLSDGDLRAQAATGLIRMPRQARAETDVAEEVARAHRTFVQGIFAVFAGGRQIVDLDEELAFRLGEPVVFLRLVALVGG
ncbi:hypothetical protein [Nocardia sp. NBC_01329]|uniref:hypothetical protein n=1 Tax=Nocardia sp. NBC_01329 TaxID=2903594 RepID=UPI002E1629E7|nr:hypothetical protein OG405_09255 [Nocardia sp. NBC_01329]